MMYAGLCDTTAQRAGNEKQLDKHFRRTLSETTAIDELVQSAGTTALMMAYCRPLIHTSLSKSGNNENKNDTSKCGKYHGVRLRTSMRVSHTRAYIFLWRYPAGRINRKQIIYTKARNSAYRGNKRICRVK